MQARQAANTTVSILLLLVNNKNNNPICKAPKALASEALVADQSWVLLKW